MFSGGQNHTRVLYVVGFEPIMFWPYYPNRALLSFSRAIMWVRCVCNSKHGAVCCGIGPCTVQILSSFSTVF